MASEWEVYICHNTSSVICYYSNGWRSRKSTWMVVINVIHYACSFLLENLDLILCLCVFSWLDNGFSVCGFGKVCQHLCKHLAILAFLVECMYYSWFGVCTYLGGHPLVNIVINYLCSKDHNPIQVQCHYRGVFGGDDHDKCIEFLVTIIRNALCIHLHSVDTNQETIILGGMVSMFRTRSQGYLQYWSDSARSHWTWPFFATEQPFWLKTFIKKNCSLFSKYLLFDVFVLSLYWEESNRILLFIWWT